MRRLLAGCGVGLLAITIVGCDSDGLSARENHGNTVSNFTYSLYDPGDAPAGPPPQVRFPMKVAVAQVGEVAAPQKLIDTLRADSAAFTNVQSIPSGSVDSTDYHYGQAQLSSSVTSVQVAKMQRLARDLGADDLLIIGGTVDYGAQSTALSVFDLTIVGAFVVPSNDVQANAKATATLIDLRSGKPVQTFDVQSQRSTLAPSFSVEEGKVRLLQDLRDDVVKKLSDRIVADCNQRAGITAAKDPH